MTTHYDVNRAVNPDTSLTHNNSLLNDQLSEHKDNIEDCDTTLNFQVTKNINSDFSDGDEENIDSHHGEGTKDVTRKSLFAMGNTIVSGLCGDSLKGTTTFNHQSSQVLTNTHTKGLQWVCH